MAHIQTIFILNCDAFAKTENYSQSPNLQSSLTQCIDAVSKCKQGSVDVCSFYHSLPTILEGKMFQ